VDLKGVAPHTRFKNIDIAVEVALRAEGEVGKHRKNLFRKSTRVYPFTSNTLGYILSIGGYCFSKHGTTGFEIVFC